MQLCRVGFLRVWSSVEDVVLAFGGPRTGKTQWLAGRIIDAPGAVLVTSTRTDLLDQTRALRVRRGPVFVFNAVGLAGLDSTITFDPLTGCADPVTAAERATDMLGAVSRGNSGDREFWEGQARRVLAALLHAAALDEGRSTMADVLCVGVEPGRRRASGHRAAAAEPRCRRSATTPASSSPRTTRPARRSPRRSCPRWAGSPAPPRPRPARRRRTPFDVADLLVRRATVYLLGGEETQAAPLVCALTGHIAREARRLAATRPGGRLDPPLTARPRRGRADLAGAAGSVVGGHGRARGDDRRELPVPRPDARPLRRRQDRRHHQQLRRHRPVRRHPRPRRPQLLVAPVRRPRRARSPPPTCTGGSPPAPPAASRCWRPRSWRTSRPGRWSCSGAGCRRSSGGPSRRGGAATSANLNAPESRWRRARGRALAALGNGARTARGGRPRRAARPTPDLDLPTVDLTPPRADGPTPGPWGATPWELPPGDGGPNRPDEPGRWN